MAQLVKLTGNSAPSHVSPPGYEVVDKGVATEALTRGDLVTIGASGISKCAAGALEAHGMSLMDYIAGQENAEYLVQGEMDGWAAQTPGIALYPSASVAGGIQTDVVANAPVRMRMVRAGRIRVNFV